MEVRTDVCLFERLYPRKTAIGLALLDVMEDWPTKSLMVPTIDGWTQKAYKSGQEEREAVSAIWATWATLAKAVPGMGSR